LNIDEEQDREKAQEQAFLAQGEKRIRQLEAGTPKEQTLVDQSLSLIVVVSVLALGWKESWRPEWDHKGQGKAEPGENPHQL